MIRNAIFFGVLIVMTGGPAMAQQRVPSPDGHAATEILGRYEGGCT
jgi:hypothetical protein